MPKSAVTPQNFDRRAYRHAYRMSSERYDVLEDPLPRKRCQERGCIHSCETVMETALGPRWFCPRHYQAREEHYRVIGRILHLKRDILEL